VLPQCFRKPTLNEAGLQRLMTLYCSYHERSRTHLSLDKDTPIPRRNANQSVLSEALPQTVEHADVEPSAACLRQRLLEKEEPRRAGRVETVRLRNGLFSPGAFEAVVGRRSSLTARQSSTLLSGDG
jgi:hypothetical protein